MVNVFERFREFRKGRRERRTELGERREVELKRLSELEKEKQIRIAGVREAQLRRAIAEAGIAKQRQKLIQARQKTIQIARPQLFFQQQPFGLQQKQKKKKLGPTPGLGRFRVL
ncbi:MAG: hypothetical protein IH934_04650 [Nanoarchaeota archaeon]|nr:hypothetical protein [Nanoarchaeota archaeon]